MSALHCWVTAMLQSTANSGRHHELLCGIRTYNKLIILGRLILTVEKHKINHSLFSRRKKALALGRRSEKFQAARLEIELRLLSNGLLDVFVTIRISPPKLINLL